LKLHVLLVTSHTISFTNGTVSSYKVLNPEHDMLCSFKPVVIIVMYYACKNSCVVKKCHRVSFKPVVIIIMYYASKNNCVVKKCHRVSFKPVVIIVMYYACKNNCEAKKCHRVSFQ